MLNCKERFYPKINIFSMKDKQALQAILEKHIRDWRNEFIKEYRNLEAIAKQVRVHETKDYF
jgi:hypothetical protein